MPMAPSASQRLYDALGRLRSDKSLQTQLSDALNRALSQDGWAVCLPAANPQVLSRIAGWRQPRRIGSIGNWPMRNVVRAYHGTSSLPLWWAAWLLSSQTFSVRRSNCSPSESQPAVPMLGDRCRWAREMPLLWRGRLPFQPSVLYRLKAGASHGLLLVADQALMKTKAGYP